LSTHDDFKSFYDPAAPEPPPLPVLNENQNSEARHSSVILYTVVDRYEQLTWIDSKPRMQLINRRMVPKLIPYPLRGIGD
jgi:hypothetical protein